MFSKTLEFTLNWHLRVQGKNAHEFITVEHLLLALFDNPAAGQVLRGVRSQFGASPQ